MAQDVLFLNVEQRLRKKLEELADVGGWSGHGITSVPNRLALHGSR